MTDHRAALRRDPVVVRVVVAVVLLVFIALVARCAGSPTKSAGGNSAASVSRDQTPTVTAGHQFDNPLPGMPPVLHGDVYGATRAGMLSPTVAGDPAMLYVPDSAGTKVTVISQDTRQIVGTFETGQLSQHVVPSYDLKTLYTNASAANQLVPIDPKTSKPGTPIGVPRPYNLYFTPDGKAAIVMVEQHDTIRFSDPKTFASIAEVNSPTCKGPNHADFAANGQFFVVTCEFSGHLLMISTTEHKIIGDLRLPTEPIASGADSHLMHASMPQDVRLSPDGLTFYVADMGTNQLVMIDALNFTIKGAIGMPKNPHGIYFSRDGQRMYVSDRGAGEVSVIDWTTNKIVDTWVIPGGGSPDMGGVSADGTMLWMAGRYDRVVYGFDTKTGKLVAKIPVPEQSPHGIAVWPQPGRYSLGHTGNMR